MISDQCDFDDFVMQANGRDYQDIIYLAEREATAAERRTYRVNVPADEKVRCGKQYAECLKGFISFMRYGIKPARIDQDALRHFDRIRNKALQIQRPDRRPH